MPSQLVQRIGQRIYAARIQVGLKQEAVARQAGLTGTYISRLERGLVAHPRVIDLRRIARVLGLTYDELIAEDSADGGVEVETALVDLTGDPRLSRLLATLARHWGLLSPSERQQRYAALERSLTGATTADAASSPGGVDRVLDPLQLLSLEEAASLLHVRYRTVQAIPTEAG